MAYTEAIPDSTTGPASESYRAHTEIPQCLIHSCHPAAMRLVSEGLCADPELSSRMTLCSKDIHSFHRGQHNILIIDTCSVENWQECINIWSAKSGFTIALVSAEAYTATFELQLLYAGTEGVLSFADNLGENIPKAVRTVAEGRLWIRREVLNLYVKRTADVLRKILRPDYGLTSRESQVLSLVRQRLSNRRIAQQLEISERTAKFHISNILKKLKLDNRHQILFLDSPQHLPCPDWLMDPPGL
jgi:DNA-binding NarL/FixJ family response regulator